MAGSINFFLALLTLVGKERHEMKHSSIVAINFGCYPRKTCNVERKRDTHEESHDRIPSSP